MKLEMPAPAAETFKFVARPLYNGDLSVIEYGEQSLGLHTYADNVRDCNLEDLVLPTDIAINLAAQLNSLVVTKDDY